MSYFICYSAECHYAECRYADVFSHPGSLYVHTMIPMVDYRQVGRRSDRQALRAGGQVGRRSDRQAERAGGKAVKGRFL